MSDYHLAQINIARFQLAMDDPHIVAFTDQLDAVNALADNSPGFIWRLQGEEGNAMAISAFDDENLLINMSVWASAEALFDYTYKTAHTQIMSRRKEWFGHLQDAYMALWWIAAGHIPGPQEGRERLDMLRKNGPSPEAFNFKNRFPAP